jgi:hypothetical protein
MHAVVAHQVSSAETYGHRLATQGRDGRAWSLRVHMQVRLSGIAAVTDETEHVPGFHDLSCLHGDTAPLQVAQDNPHGSAFENDVIPGHVPTIGLGRGHVGRAILREHDSPPTRRQHRIAVDWIRCGICRKKPWNA